MRTSRRLVLLALLAAAPLAGLGALARSHSHGRADLAFCNQSEVGSLDPVIATGSSEGRLLGALFEGLTRSDPAGGSPLPGVAHAWESSPDGLTWRFQLRSDALWSDGSSVTAEDFVFSWLRLLAPATAARYAYLLWCVEGAREYSTAALELPRDASGVGIRSDGPHVLELHLVRPCPYLPQLTSYHPLSPVQRSSLARHGSSWIKPGKLVGNGAFRLAERRIRDRIRLVRSETYWGAEEVELETIDVFAVEASTTQLNMYLTGLVDWMVKPPPELYDVLLPRPDSRTGPQFGTSFLRFNTRRAPLDDQRVRRALALSLDRETLARDVMRGGQTAIDSLVPPGLADYEPASFGPFDPDAARSLLSEAGHAGGIGLPVLELLYPHNAATADFCAAVADTWRRELGLQVRLVNQAFEVYLDSTVSGRYDVAWGTWIGDYLDPSTFLEAFLSGSGNNRTGWQDPVYDSLLETAATLPDVHTRALRFREAEQLLLDCAPIAPLFQRRNIQLVSPRITGFADNLLDVHPLRDLRTTGPAR